MDYGRILRRAWDVTWRYRALWVFGILLALFAAGSGGSGGGGGNSSYSGDGGSFGGLSGLPSFSGSDWASIAAVIGVFVVGMLLFVLVLSLVGVFVRYISTTAIVRMVDHTEDTGEKLRWTKGFRLGWSWRSVRLFLIDLLVTIAAIIVFTALCVIALLPLLLWIANDTTIGILGTVATVGMFVLIVVLGIAVALVISLVRPFVYRMAILRDMGVFESIRRGVALVRSRFAQAGTMWLIMVGIKIAFGIAELIAVVALACIALVVAGIPAVAVYAVGAALAGEATGAIMAAVVGVPLFFVVVGVPCLFAAGLWEVYDSTVWTLTFRELTGPAALAAPDEIVPVDVPSEDVVPTDVAPEDTDSAAVTPEDSTPADVPPDAI